MTLLTASRALTLSAIFAYFKEYGFIFVIWTLFINLVSVLCFFMFEKSMKFTKSIRYMVKGDQNQGKKHHVKLGAISGAIISLFAPCIPYDEFSHFYLYVGTLSNLSYFVGYIIMVVLVEFDVHPNQDMEIQHELFFIIIAVTWTFSIFSLHNLI